MTRVSPYQRKRTCRLRSAFVWVCALIIGALIVGQWLLGNVMVVQSQDQQSTSTTTTPTIQQRIEQMKWKVVDELAECESGGLQEGYRDAVVVKDANGYYARGRWQWQLKSVQHYVRVLDGRDITLNEAALIAHTRDRARTLTYRTIWETEDGIWNWANCAKRLGLAEKVEVIKALIQE